MQPLFIIVPFISVIILNLLPKALTYRCAGLAALALSATQVIVVLVPESFKRFASSSISVFHFNLAVDGLSRLLLLCIGIVVFVSAVVGASLLHEAHRKFSFANLLVLAMVGMNGVVLVRDLFSLYVYLEITAVVSFILIAFDQDASGIEGAFKYIIMSAVATVIMLASIALLLLFSGSLDFGALSSAIKSSPYNQIIVFTVGMFICGFFIKSGLVPFHGWLPDAYSAAPAAVSVLLAGVVTKVVGVYVLIRIVTAVFGFTASIKQVLFIVGALSVVIGALASLGQKDFKRMLAYSSISQVGYIILGLGCGSPLGIAGAVFHLFNHAIFKSLLFVNAAAVEKQAGTRDMEKMSGLAERMPVTGLTSCLASLSAAGIPPLAGFWSKLIIIMALWLGGYYWVAVVAVFASVLTLAYFLSLQRRVFFGTLSDDYARVVEAGFSINSIAILLAAIIIGAGLFYPLVINRFILPVAVSVLGG